MMRIDYLLRAGFGGLPPLPALPVSPFNDRGALQEAQLLDIRVDAVSGVAGLLFELRQSLHFTEANTGVLVAHGLSRLEWIAPRRPSMLTAWSVEGTRAEAHGDGLVLQLLLLPDPGSDLRLEATRATFVVGNVAGLPQAPPDYSRSLTRFPGHLS